VPVYDYSGQYDDDWGGLQAMLGLGWLQFVLTADEGRFGWDIFCMMGDFDRDWSLQGAKW